MPGDVASVRTYRQYDADDLGLDAEEWTAFREYMDVVSDAFRTAKAERRGTPAEIEQYPPRITGGTFRPEGWVGRYGEFVEVHPDREKLDAEEYERLLRDVQSQIELLGATTVSTAFPITVDGMVDVRARLASFSRALVGLTERLRARRLPVEVSRERTTGPTPEGRPVVGATLRQRARGSTDVVSERVSFDIDSPANLLLVRFHAELAERMEALADEYPYYRRAFADRVRYHRQLTTDEPFASLLDDALETAFTDPEVLRDLRVSNRPVVEELVDVWNAYVREQNFELTLAESFDTAVKPMGTTYELWCLHWLLDVLSAVTGEPIPTGEGITARYEFGDATLHYNVEARDRSRFIADLAGSAVRPDFVLTVEDEPVWVLDAKFKLSMELDDYRQLTTYLLDFIPMAPGRGAAFLSPTTDGEVRRRSVDEYEFLELPLRPRTRSTVWNEFAETLSELISGDE